MTELIESVQVIEPGSEIVELYEIELESSTLYFHSGLDSTLSQIQFRDRVSPYTIRNYVAIPIEMSGVSFNADGAVDRPELTIANVLNTLSSSIGGNNDDLIGKKVTKRTTLKKYLVGETGDDSPPVEFPIKKFYIDRIASENNTTVTFELSAPFDISGIKLPNRTIIGKYCSWIYQGNDLGQPGGCTWDKNSLIEYADGSGGVNSHKAYFSEEDKPIVPKTEVSAMTSAGWNSEDYETYVVYPEDSPYDANDFVEYTLEGQTTIWKASADVPDNQAPYPGSPYWVRGDLCGKTLNSCKCRFQFVPETQGTSNSIPSVDKDTKPRLPFGAFIGSLKFR